MSAHSSPVFRVDHVGSLVRPQALLKAREDFKEGKLTQEGLRRVEDAAISQIVKKQRDLGLQFFNDGEFTRGVYFDGVFNRLEGMSFIPNRSITEFKAYNPFVAVFASMGMREIPTFFCSGKIKRIKPFYADEFKYTASLVPSEEVRNIKVTMCPPTWFHQRHGSDMTYDRSIYSDDEAYFSDLTRAYREEIQELYDLGCRYIQFDDPTFCFFCSNFMIEESRAANVDLEALLDTYIRVINMCIEGRPADLRVSVHMCRGNFKGMHFCEGGYEPISDKLFNDLKADIFFLEYDTPRSGDFAPLKHVPSNKSVVLGLVSTKVPEVESVEYIRSRVEEAANAMVNPSRSKEQALQQLGISPQCGFASVSEGHVIPEEAQWQKLSVLVEAGRTIWGQSQ